MCPLIHDILLSIFDMSHWPLCGYCSHCAVQLLTGATERKLKKTSQMRGRPRVLVYLCGTEKMWGIYWDKSTFSPHLQYISNKMPTSTLYQGTSNKFSSNFQHFIEFSSFHPRPNQHFVNRPTFYQHTLLCPACKLSKWLMWGIRCENVDIGHLASDLTLSLILAGENVGNIDCIYWLHIYWLQMVQFECPKYRNPWVSSFFGWIPFYLRWSHAARSMGHDWPSSSGKIEWIEAFRSQRDMGS